MTNRNSLKLRLSIDIFPRDIDDVGLSRTSYDLQPCNLILCIICRTSIDPGSVRNNCLFVWLNRLNRIKANMRAGRSSDTFFVLQEHCENLNRRESVGAGVGYL